MLPHFYAPRSWHLPLDLGLVAESSFQKATYEENVRRVEVRPTLEKGFGKLRVDFNPVFEVHCTGPEPGSSSRSETGEERRVELRSRYRRDARGKPAVYKSRFEIFFGVR
ncbi:MAG TPA: hypothetical protein VMH81_02090 [Bryobacteraceae bacterium]|nr:hypothetical protein [Bryobacteraceae bacterium]